MRHRWISIVLLLCAAAAHAASIKISSVSISPNTVYSAQAATGTVTLSGPAPNKGMTVTLSSTNSIASPQGPLTIAAGQSSATFNVFTGQTATTQNMTITASTTGSSASAPFQVYGPNLSSVTISPSTTSAVTGSATGTVTTDMVWNGSQLGPLSIALSSSNPAVSVPPSVSIAVNGNSATFPVTIANQQVASTTTVLITATFNGGTRSGQLTLTPCGAPKAPAGPAGGGSDTIWVNDALPAGATLAGGAWDSGQASLGTQSITTGYAATTHSFAISGAASVLVPAANDSLFADVLMTFCAVPREIELGWHTSSGWHRAYYGPALIGDESGALPLGAMPATLGQWIRVTVPASSLGITNAAVDGFTAVVPDGQLWVDRLGKSCTAPTAPPPALTGLDRIWVDDTLPPDATLTGTVSTSQHASGTKSYYTGVASGVHGVGMTTINNPNFAGMNESLLAYVLLDSCAPPRAISLHMNASDYMASAGGAWGEANLLPDALVGALPTPGVWTRLEIPFSQSMWGKQVNGFSFSAYDGAAWIDVIGFGKASCPATAPAPTVPAGDVVWSDGVLGSGTTGAYFDPNQRVTGIGAATAISGVPDWHVIYPSLVDAVGALPIYPNANLVFYMLLNECEPPDEVVAVLPRSRTSAYNGVLFGTPHGWWFESQKLPMGPLPQPGVWTRVEIPASALSAAGFNWSSAIFYTNNGQAWFDHIGVNGCTMTAPPANVATTDNVWVDDSVPPGALLNGYWTTRQSASGTRSMAMPADYPETPMTIDGLNEPLTAGQNVAVYALVDSCQPANEIIVRLTASDGRSGYAYWGARNGGEPNGAHSMGTMPAAGAWTRMEVPVSLLGLNDSTITNVELSCVYGRVYFDHLGVTNGCATQTAPQPVIPGGDQVWIDDSVPAGATDVSWTTQQAASGTKSFTTYTTGGSTVIGNLSQPTVAGDYIVFYTLIDECRPTTEIRLDIWGDGGAHGTFLFNNSCCGGPMGTIWYNYLPPAGVWQRNIVPLSMIGAEGQNITTLQFTTSGGRVWFDSVGKVNIQ